MKLHKKYTLEGYIQSEFLPRSFRNFEHIRFPGHKIARNEQYFYDAKTQRIVVVDPYPAAPTHPSPKNENYLTIRRFWLKTQEIKFDCFIESNNSFILRFHQDIQSIAFWLRLEEFGYHNAKYQFGEVHLQEARIIFYDDGEMAMFIFDHQDKIKDGKPFDVTQKEALEILNNAKNLTGILVPIKISY